MTEMDELSGQPKKRKARPEEEVFRAEHRLAVPCEDEELCSHWLVKAPGPRLRGLAVDLTKEWATQIAAGLNSIPHAAVLAEALRRRMRDRSCTCGMRRLLGRPCTCGAVADLAALAAYEKELP